ncbi:MAG: DUF721 domain-containing protein [Kiritimatiellales bacterium]
MKQPNNRQLKWELARERFGIENRFPPPEKRPEKHIRDILDGILKIEKDDTEAVSLPEIIVNRWPVIAGEQLVKHVRPAYVKKGILYLYADHPGWLAESRRLPKAPLLKKFAAVSGVPKIKDIRFQLDPAIRTFRK